MERDIRILLNMTAPEDYGQLLKDGFRPGILSPAESVFLLRDVKERLRKQAGGEYPYRIALSHKERLAIAEDPGIEEALTKAFYREGIPFTEANYRQGVLLTGRILAIEEISDGMCGYFIRNGIEPTIENLYRLRFEKDDRADTAFEHSDSALAWAFPEEEFDLEEFLIREELSHENARMQAKWLKDQSLFVSAGNVRLLDLLWGMDLPFEVSRAAEIAAGSIALGENPEEASFFELPGKRRRAEHEKSFRKGNIKESKTRDALRYPEADFGEYMKALKNADEALPVLNALGIDVCADRLSAMEYLLSEEAEGFFEELSKLTGTKELISCFHKPDGGMVLSPEAYRKLQTITETGSATDPSGRMGRTLALMKELAERGYYEVPIALSDSVLRLRIRKEDGRYRVIFTQKETGGIVMNITKSPEGIHALVVGDNEEALEALRESNLLPQKLSKLFEKDVECTYLFKEDLSKIRIFYTK